MGFTRWDGTSPAPSLWEYLTLATFHVVESSACQMLLCQEVVICVKQIVLSMNLLTEVSKLTLQAASDRHLFGLVLASLSTLLCDNLRSRMSGFSGLWHECGSSHHSRRGHQCCEMLHIPWGCLIPGLCNLASLRTAQQTETTGWKTRKFWEL